MRDPARLIYPIVMATVMSFVMSGLVTAINTGIDPGYPLRWMGAWAMSAPIAAVGVMLAAPLARRITGAIVARLPRRPAERREA